MVSTRAKKKSKIQTRSSNLDENRIVLNVGGQKFETTRTTLMAFPGSMLTERFSNRNLVINKTDNFGEYFFDRSSDAFKAILECYRNRRIPFPDITPPRINHEDWVNELLFWGLASVETAALRPPVIPVALMDFEEKQSANRVRFCELVYEEMKCIMERSNGDHVPVTMWIMAFDGMLDERLPAKPVPPKRMKPSDIALYEHAEYWFIALLWFQVRSMENDLNDSLIIEFENTSDPTKGYGETHFRDIWKRMGIKIDLIRKFSGDKFQLPPVYDRDYPYEYPLSVWFDRKNPRFTNNQKYREWHSIHLEVYFTIPGSATHLISRPI